MNNKIISIHNKHTINKEHKYNKHLRNKHATRNVKNK